MTDLKKLGMGDRAIKNRLIILAKAVLNSECGSASLGYKNNYFYCVHCGGRAKGDTYRHATGCPTKIARAALAKIEAMETRDEP